MALSARRVSAPTIHALLDVDEQSGPAYRWLADGLQRLITNGRLLHDTVLPSERRLVDELGLSRTTVSRAYAELRSRGFATARHGSGTVVRLPGGPVVGGREPLRESQARAAASVAVGSGSGHVVDLTSAVPRVAVDLHDHIRGAADDISGYLGGTGYFPDGLPDLRAALADAYTERGAPTTPDQIVVTGGALSAIGIVARAALPPGANVLLETPSYPNSVASLRHQGARFTTVPIGPDGSDPDAIETAARRTRPALMLCVPDYHNPTGTLLGDDDRERCVRALVDVGAVPVVDETLVELWLDSDPGTAPLATFSDSVISVGSAGKSHWGGLRIGWIRAPRDRITAVARARATVDLGPPVLEQLVLLRLLAQGRSLADATRTRLRDNRDHLHGRITERLPGWRAARPPGGLALWWNLPAPVSSRLVESARRHGVMLTPGSTFAVEGHGLERWLRTPYVVDREDLDHAVDVLAAAWSEVTGA